jgi:hypothetical protein
LVSFGIAYYLNRILQGSLHLDQWDLIIGLLLSGSLLGFFQAIVFRRTPISPIRWFLATIIGSIIGACIYFLLFNASLSDAIVSWETYTINQATVINGNLLGIQSEQLRRLFLAFENIVLSGGFIIPIGIVQWIILRKWAKNSFLWVIILFLTYESSILNGSGGLALFVRWFVPGITLVCLISPFLIDHGASKESVRIPEH